MLNFGGFSEYENANRDLYKLCFPRSQFLTYRRTKTTTPTTIIFSNDPNGFDNKARTIQKKAKSHVIVEIK
jgi:hypothetical protein